MDRFLLGGGNSIEPLNVYMAEENPEIYDGAQDLSITVTYLCDMFWLHFAEEAFQGVIYLIIKPKKFCSRKTLAGRKRKLGKTCCVFLISFEKFPRS